MELIATDVHCHAGYRADEYPTRFLGLDRWIDVVAVVDQWYQAACTAGRPAARYFRVEGSDGEHHLLKHDQDEDRWYLVLRE